MKIQFRNNRLELKTEDVDEESFAGKLSRLIAGVSNEFMSWYGIDYELYELGKREIKESLSKKQVNKRKKEIFAKYGINIRTENKIS